MATATIMSVMSADDKSVHPFFTRPRQSLENPGEPVEILEDEQPEKPKRTNSKRKKPREDDPKQKKQKTLGEIINPKAAAPSPVSDEHTSAPPVNESRRKRRRTNDSEAIEVGAERGNAYAGAEDRPKAAVDDGRRSPIVLVPASSSPPQDQRKDPEQREAVAAKTPPKKLLRLNAHGKFSSPPSKSKDGDEPAQGGPRRSGRQRKPANRVAEKKPAVVLRYGGDNSTKRQEIGERINRVLGGEEKITLVDKTSKQRTPKKAKSSKPTHPFFAKGGKETKPPAKQHSPRKASAITPGKLKVQSFGDRVQNAQETNHTYISALLKDRLMIKHPGAKDPPFPAKEQTHVRDLNVNAIGGARQHLHSDPSKGQRKRKQAKVPFPEEQSILSRFASELEAEDDRILRADGFFEPDASLCIPQRLLISGEEIAEKIIDQLSLPLVESDVDELASTPRKQPHPALQRLHARVPQALTAFDHCKGETQAWSQKYAPTHSADVLQPEKEMTILRDWMKSLAVQSVVGSLVPASKAVAMSKPAEKPKKKRKKKSDEMDDFLVDSDEDTHDMSEIIDDDNGLKTPRRTAHSVVQDVQDGTKLSNAVLLSGPHGCGKTAAAYAVAKELGFKVFEISSSERRSGRDVLDRVGDMSENHLVKHHGVEDSSEMANEEPSKMEEAFQKDLQTGRQGKMSAFFKPQVTAKKSEPKKIVKEKVIKAVQESLKKPAKDQQQSLILLEEIDILFKDDKEFWTTVLKLISTSKRPFIMTCNDEDLVPLQAMSLHAILRFVPPSVDLATDYMLLLAAAEGHLLKRQAVLSLYEQHGHDLRASITKLDFWCQMGIGDPRGGLSWIYQRWPPGSDVDEQGRTLRIVSEGTYQQGMGIPDHGSTDEALMWMWSEYGIEPSTALGWPDASFEDLPRRDDVGIRELSRFARLAEALSAADACTANGLPSELDTTQPDLPDKAYGNYIEGMKLLQTDENIDWTGTSMEILTTLTATAYRAFSNRKIDSSNIVEKTLARKPHSMNDDMLSRHAFSCLDAIAVPSEMSLTTGLQQSAFDSTLATVTLDLAPYVRSIVQYDQALEEQRTRLDLLTTDGRRTKRARTTRAARSALEGGQRATVRRDRYFTKNLDTTAVLATGGETWPRFAGVDGTASEASKEGTGTASTAAEDEEIRYE